MKNLKWNGNDKGDGGTGHRSFQKFISFLSFTGSENSPVISLPWTLLFCPNLAQVSVYVNCLAIINGFLLFSPMKNLFHSVSIVWNASELESPWSCTSNLTLCSIPVQQHEVTTSFIVWLSKKGSGIKQPYLYPSFPPPTLFLYLFNFPLNPSQGLLAYVMSLNICAVLQEVRHAKTEQNVPLCTPTEVGQMATHDLSLVNCL